MLAPSVLIADQINAVSDEARLRERLRSIEALYAGATTPGERDAAGAARQRMIERIASSAAETPVEWQFTGLHTWNLRLLIALAKRYGLKPYRYPRQRRSTLMVKAPEPFLRDVFSPEFDRMAETLSEHLTEVAQRVIAAVLETEPPVTQIGSAAGNSTRVPPRPRSSPFLRRARSVKRLRYPLKRKIELIDAPSRYTIERILLCAGEVTSSLQNSGFFHRIIGLDGVL